MPSCVERLLLTAAALTLYVNFRRGLIRVHRSKDVRHNVRSFPPFMAGKQKQTSTAGRVAAAATATAAAFTLPKMPFSSQQHSLMSSCRLPSDDAAAKVKLKLKGRRRRRCCHRNEPHHQQHHHCSHHYGCRTNPLIHTPHSHHTNTSPFTLSHTPLIQCVFFCFHLLFFSFFNSIVHLWRFLQFSG